jgi:hypothetical protein
MEKKYKVLLNKTVPSFRIALAMEEEEWKKSFRNALDKSDQKKFFDDKRHDIPRLCLLPWLPFFSRLRLTVPGYRACKEKSGLGGS